jgi:hypothetical protein
VEARDDERVARGVAREVKRHSKLIMCKNVPRRWNIIEIN